MDDFNGKLETAKLLAGSRFFSLVIAAAVPVLLAACVPEHPRAPRSDCSLVMPAVMAGAPPVAGSSIRVGGDRGVSVSGSNGDFRSGWCRIDTQLPDGYPAPTPPGAIDLKGYPSVRLAEVSGQGSPDDGMNAAFWPLFNHIKRHGIAMTSPVEMNYAGLEVSEPRSWSMAFLYRSPELNSIGADGPVTVRDAGPLTVVAVGLKGSYSMALVQRGMEQIERWLTENPGWQPDGDWRALYYNGPSLLWWNKWAEVQLPVRLSATALPLDLQAGLSESPR